MVRPFFWLGADAEPHRGDRKVADIQRAVAIYFKLPRRIMTSATRDYARQRQVAMYLSRELTPLSLPNIGMKFGGRDHTTVMHAIRTVDLRISHDADFAADVAEIRASLAQ